MEFVKSFKQTKLIKYIFVALIGSIILAVSSKIKIPFYPVPMTMQTMVVLMIGIAFGWKLGLATVSLYLFEGIIGLPVFSGTPEKGILIFEEIAKIILPISAIKIYLISFVCLRLFTNSINPI